MAIYVNSGQTSSFSNIRDGDEVIAYDGATVSGATVYSGGYLGVHSGAVLTGRVDLIGEGSAGVSGIVEASPFVASGGLFTLAAGATMRPPYTFNLIGGTVYLGTSAAVNWTTNGGNVVLLSGVTYNYSSPIPEGNNTITVTSGAMLGNFMMTSGNTAVVSRYGILGVSQTLSSGVTLDMGGILRGNLTVNSGATVVIRSGMIQTGAVIRLSGGVVSSYQNALFKWDASGSELHLCSGATYSAASTLAEGNNRIVVSRGATLMADAIAVGNTVSVCSGGEFSAEMVSSNANVVLDRGATLGTTVNLADGASMTLWEGAGGAVDLNGSTNHALVISGMQNGGTLTTRILGFDGSVPGNSDAIRITGLTKDKVQKIIFPYPDMVRIILKTGSMITMTIVGVEATGFKISTLDDSIICEVCFLPGTMILTPEGEVAVESLKPGDLVSSLDPDNGTVVARAVRWAGKGHGTTRLGLPDDEAGYPVRLVKGALGNNHPHTDLLVTPEHGFMFDGRVVPARMLVNGVSIFYDKSIDSYDYHHIELDTHSVIWANGVETESYRDTGNRMKMVARDNSVAMLAGSFRRQPGLTIDTSYDFVGRIWQNIVDRLDEETLPVVPDASQLTFDADLHLVTDRGAVLRPLSFNNGLARFFIPDHVRMLRLISRVARPCDVKGPCYDDRRWLGVLVGDMTLYAGSKSRALTGHLTSPSAGWHKLTQEGERWTDGDAVILIPADMAPGNAILAIQIRAAGPYLNHPVHAVEALQGSLVA